VVWEPPTSICALQDGLGELRAAAAAILSSAGDRIRVADFGSAEGANSSIFLDAFVAAVRELEVGCM
jgi:hypothetical protein